MPLLLPVWESFSTLLDFFLSTPGSKLIRLISQICPSVVMGAVERRTAPADFQPSDPDWVQAGTGGVLMIKHESERLEGAPGATASAIALQPARISHGATSSGAQETLRPQTGGRAHRWAQIKPLKMMDVVGIHCRFLKC